MLYVEPDYLLLALIVQVRCLLSLLFVFRVLCACLLECLLVV